MKMIIIFMLAIVMCGGVAAAAPSPTTKDIIKTEDLNLAITADSKTRITYHDKTTYFDSDTVYFEDEGKHVKYSIDFSGTKKDTDGYYTTFVTSPWPIEKVGGISYIIADLKHSFTMFYNKTDCYNKTYTEGKGVLSQEECNHIPLVNTRLLDEHTILVKSKIEYYDPQISVWNNGSRTAQYDCEENNENYELEDSAGNPNNHNGTLNNAVNFSYIASPTGSGFACNYTYNGYHDLANKEDLDGLGEMELSFLIYGHQYTDATEHYVMGYDSNEFKASTRSGRLRLGFLGLSVTDCNIDWWEYGAFMTDGNPYYITVRYNGTHCQVINNVTTIIRTEAASGTQADISSFYLGHGETPSQGTSTEGAVDCVTLHIGSTLSDSARQDAYDACFGGAPANNAPTFDHDLANQSVTTPASLAYNINCTDADADPITYYDNTSLFNINQSGYISDTPTDAEEGNYSILITCGDGTDNTTDSFIYEVINGTTPPGYNDTINPVISNLWPADNLNTTATTWTFNGTVTDNILVENVSIFVDGVRNNTNYTAGNVTHNYTLTFVDGTYSWLFEACDNSSNCINSSPRQITIDTTAPVLSNLRNTSMSSTFAPLAWNYSEYCNYTLYWYNNTARNNSFLVGSQSSSVYGVSALFTVTPLAANTTYFINLTVYDGALNFDYNDTFNFTTTSTSAPVMKISILDHGLEWVRLQFS